MKKDKDNRKYQGNKKGQKQWRKKIRTKTIKNYKGYKKGQRQSKRDKAKMSEVFICRESD